MVNFLANLDPADMKAVTVFWIVCAMVLGVANRKRPAIIFGLLAGVFLGITLWQNYYLLPRPH